MNRRTETAGMMRLADAARLLGAAATDCREWFQRVTTDSRRLQAGDLFIALRGERFDGHDFVSQALQQGAVGAVVEASCQGIASSPRVIRVDSTPEALSALAAAWRRQINPQVIAVTGSNGKTTVKDMLALVLRRAAANQGQDPQLAVLATEGNLNNTLGLPMTLLRLRAGHRWAVVEMGMNHEGEIAAMTRVARPDVALVNNVQRAHLGLLGSLEAVARAKGEIFQGLPRQGMAVLPAADAMIAELRRSAAGHRVIDFALESPAEVTGHRLPDIPSAGGISNAMQMRFPTGEIAVRLNVPGRHNLLNALAAGAAALALGIDATSIQQGLESFQGVPQRLQSKFSARGALILDDTYNANPDSVAAAIAVLAGRTGRRVLVLGDLGELGDSAPALHAEVGRQARDAGIDDFFTVGEWAREAARAFGPHAHHFEDIETLVATLKPQLNADASVLVKGSRFMEMERVVEGLVQ